MQEFRFSKILKIKVFLKAVLISFLKQGDLNLIKVQVKANHLTKI